jgi:hypothetical protein
MKSSSIIFLLSKYPNNRDIKRFQINDFKKEIKVTLISLEGIINKSKAKNKLTKNFISINTIAELDLILNPNNFLLLFFPFNKKTHGIHNIITKKNIEYAYVSLGMQPRSLKSTYKSLIYKKVFGFNQKKPKYQFVGGSENEFSKSSLLKDSKTQIVNTGSFDYVESITEAQKKILNKDYFVFIDDMYESHPDYDTTLINSSYYFNVLNKILKTYETKYNMECIISLHPRTTNTRAKLFNFRVIENSTKNLVRHCKFTVVHFSTSINFAIFFKKPIIQIDFDLSYKSNYYKCISKTYSRETDSIYLLESKGFENKSLNLFSINEAKYLSFKNKYLYQDAKNSVVKFVDYFNNL